MLSPTTANTWSFQVVLDFLHAYPSCPASTNPTEEQPYPKPTPTPKFSRDEGRRSPHLGNFSPIFEKFKIAPQDPLTTTDGESPGKVPSLSDIPSTLPSSPLDQASEEFEDFIRVKEVRWQDEVEGVTTKTSLQKHDTTKRAEVRDPSLGLKKVAQVTNDSLNGKHSVQSSSNAPARGHNRRRRPRTSTNGSRGYLSDFESESDLLGKSHQLSKEDRSGLLRNSEALPGMTSTSLLSASKLTPVWVSPPPSGVKSPTLPKPQIFIDPDNITPLLLVTREEKKARILNILKRKLGIDTMYNFNLNKALSQYGGDVVEHGIHIFVDSSNILIGFHQSLKFARGLNKNAYTKPAPFSFHSLAIIMERGRSVGRRVLVGSSDRSGVQPEYMHEARRCGYEVCSLDRVEKLKEDRTGIRDKRRSCNGYGTSGQSSGSEGQNKVMKMTEQGVDEILHMKMLESIVDAKRPTTMVLATGDAAAAEYSEGFLKNVERALEKGWLVELVAWRHSLSKAYKSRPFLEKWSGRFRVLELEDFTEELLAIYLREVMEEDQDSFGGEG